MRPSIGRRRHSSPLGAASPSHGHHPALDAANDATKWAVSGAAGAALLVRRDAVTAYVLVGAVAAAFVCKALKYAINHARPPTARKADPGMPSSHANSLAFLATSVVAVLLRSGGSGAKAAAACVFTLAGCLAWLRVGLGYHTYPQVAAGLALGTISALAWDVLGTQVALPAVATSPAAGAALVACVSCAVVAFVGFNMRHWARGGG